MGLAAFLASVMLLSPAIILAKTEAAAHFASSSVTSLTFSFNSSAASSHADLTAEAEGFAGNSSILRQAFTALNTGAQQTANAAGSVPVRWRDILEQPREWYGSDEAVRIADNVLAYQRNTGGWPKNIEMAAVLTERQLTEAVRQKSEDDSTIDNGATYTQLFFLARVVTARGLERHRNAFNAGVDYLLRAQYDNGGWPQYYPRLTRYYKLITFNDGAMVNVLRLLRDIAQRKSAYRFVDEERRVRAERAVQKGIDCILRTQIVVRGVRTVWCAQYDEVTLAPATARTYEVASLSGSESVGIVRFLMSIEQPSAQVIEAIECAIAWFQRAKITGLRWVETRDASVPGGIRRAAVSDPNAGPLWARFYEIETNRPIFVGRNGVIKYDVAQIEEERRNGYDWYTDSPLRLINEDYPAWQRRVRQQPATS